MYRGVYSEGKDGDGQYKQAKYDRMQVPLETAFGEYARQWEPEKEPCLLLRLFPAV